MFQTHRATGDCRGVPARLDRAQRRPLPAAAVTISICPQGVAPERMPKADATELAPKKSAAETLQREPPRWRVSCLYAKHGLPSAGTIDFFGEASERRP